MKFKLKDFEELANKRTGLVPMVHNRSIAPYSPGQIAGYPPKTAMKLYEDGDCEIYGIARPKEDQLYQSRNPAMNSPPPGVVTSKAVTPQNEKKDGDGLVEIPSDWEQLHHFKRVALAKKLTGEDVKTDDGGKAADKADAIIRAEVEKRAKPA